MGDGGTHGETLGGGMERGTLPHNYTWEQIDSPLIDTNSSRTRCVPWAPLINSSLTPQGPTDSIRSWIHGHIWVQLMNLWAHMG